MANFVAKNTVTIKAPVEKVWQALVDPAIIKQYLFGTDVKSDWLVGSSITYSGVWNGQAYEDKGKVLAIEPHKLLRATYWSSLGGLADTPENYNVVAYELEDLAGETRLTVSQDNNPSQESADNAQKNWSQTLKGMKEILEK